MNRSNDNLTLVNRNWKLQVNGKFVGLFGLYNAIGQFNFDFVIKKLAQCNYTLSFDRACFRPMRYNGKLVKVTAIAK